MLYNNEMNKKYCTGKNSCGLEKPLTEFYSMKASKDHLMYSCKTCVKAYINKNYEKNKETTLIRKSKNPNQFILTAVKSRCKRNNQYCNLELDDIIVPKYCPVLNIELKHSKEKISNTSPSLDRINNDIGYVKNNVIVVSWKVNNIKNNSSLEDMKTILDKFNVKNNNTDINQNLNYYKRKIVNHARDRAKEKNMEFTITKNDIIIPNYCPIFGIEIIKGIGVANFTDNSPSLDRIDNSLGYIPENVRIISWKANRLKSQASFEEYEKIYLFYKNLMQN